MNDNSVTNGVVRAGLAASGGAAMFATHDELIQLLGAVATILTIVWSIAEKIRARKPQPPAPTALPLLLMLSLLAVAASGCMGVPKTDISVNPANITLRIKSPKDIGITNLVATVTTNGTVSISIGEYSSKNNAAVIAEVAKQNAAMAQAVGDIGAKGIDAAIRATAGK